MENKECPETREDPKYQEIQIQTQLTATTYFLIFPITVCQNLGPLTGQALVRVVATVCSGARTDLLSVEPGL